MSVSCLSNVRQTPPSGHRHIAYQSKALKKIYSSTLLHCIEGSCGTQESCLSSRVYSGDACFIQNFKLEYFKKVFLVRDQIEPDSD